MFVCLLSCWLMTAFHPLYAQNGVRVEGVVRDEQGLPLSGATVGEKGSPGNASVTDNDGHFALLLKGRSNEIVISFVGYESAFA